jgi:CDGSH-type Zn-finger protein
MTDSEKIEVNQPSIVELEKSKTYFWCSCGQSRNQPFCDGSHKATDFMPLKFTTEESKSAALCKCKGSRNAPYRDGTHMKIG